MPRYFKPQQTEDKRNYAVTRKTRNGKLVRDQLPQEGIYTEYEMSRIQEKIPGEWVDVPKRKVAFIFGLRQVLS